MSGGVDSSVAAYLLKSEGYNITGVTIRTWMGPACRENAKKTCCSSRDLSDAMTVSKKLGIELLVLDAVGDFNKCVIQPFVDTYLEGKTPNPCIDCNNLIKFGILLQKADELGADFIATGHYAKRHFDNTSGRWCIREGKDKAKDQSYVLFGLTQEQLKRSLLPLGDYTKDQIRQIAQNLELHLHDKDESQEICFVDGHYGDFVESHSSTLPKKGRVVDLEGNYLGDHEGYYRYTIGQRKGMGIAGKSVRYVVDINSSKNQVVLGAEKDLYRRSMKIGDLNWMLEPSVNRNYSVKIRSRNHRKSSGVLVYLCDNEALFRFKDPVKSVTPGQAAVLYNDDTVVGGGWIQQAALENTAS